MSKPLNPATLKQAERELEQLEGFYKELSADAALTAASMAPPPAGTAADVVSLGRSLWKGDWGGALLDAVGIIPIVGDGIKGTVKGTKIAAKMKEVSAAIKAAKVKLAKMKKNAAAKKAKATKDATKNKTKNNSVQACKKCDKEAGGGIIEKKNVGGGAHRQTTKPVGDEKDSHHMPDRNADPNVHPSDGPAIKMDPKDHAKTSSNGRNGLEGKKYRAETAEMIKDGKYRDAMAREIKDVRRAAQEVSGDRTKYNTNIQEMLDYAKESGQLPSK